MKLWQVAPFLSLTFGEVCNLKREDAKLPLLFSNYKPHQKWVKKRGNLSEFHSERNYYLQNWYFKVMLVSEFSFCLFQTSIIEEKGTVWSAMKKSRCQDFKVEMPFFQPFYVMKLKNCILLPVKISLPNSNHKVFIP